MVFTGFHIHTDTCHRPGLSASSFILTNQWQEMRPDVESALASCSGARCLSADFPTDRRMRHGGEKGTGPSSGAGLAGCARGRRGVVAVPRLACLIISTVDSLLYSSSESKEESWPLLFHVMNRPTLHFGPTEEELLA